MGLYSAHVLPRCLAWAMSGKDFMRLRGDALSSAGGSVLEIGFGAGLNLPHYPSSVSELHALEPARVNRKLAGHRVAASHFPVRWIEQVAERIPLEEDSVDCVTSTWTLCTVEDPDTVLSEVRRVLRPGGRLIFLEHGLSPRVKTARWQRRLNGIQRRLAGGCNLDRDISHVLAEAGFSVGELSHPPLKGPRVLTYLYQGVATPMAGQQSPPG